MPSPRARGAPDADLRPLPIEVLRRLRADPLRAPEHLALAAAASHGPAAADWEARRRSQYALRPGELARMAKRRHAALARAGGAAGGAGGIATIVPDLALLAWIQSRMVFFIAAAEGFDPVDRMRPAELLVLQGIYDAPEMARAALDGAGRQVALAYLDARLGRDERALTTRLARMVGRQATERAAARLIPLVGIAFNAVANERQTRALADRAIVFYGGARSVR